MFYVINFGRQGPCVFFGAVWKTRNDFFLIDKRLGMIFFFIDKRLGMRLYLEMRFYLYKRLSIILCIFFVWRPNHFLRMDLRLWLNILIWWGLVDRGGVFTHFL